MPTYGCEPPEPPSVSPELREGVLEAMQRVRDACGINMDDETLRALVNEALDAYHAAP